jgi:hypothetical protein
MGGEEHEEVAERAHTRVQGRMVTAEGALQAVVWRGFFGLCFFFGCLTMTG